MPKTISEADRKAIRNTYAALDKNGDGKICPTEMAKVLQTLGGVQNPTLTGEEAKTIIRGMDYNGNGSVSLMEFEAMVAAQMGCSMSKFDLIQYFGKFDKNNSGKIAKDDVKSIMKAFTCGAKDEKIDETIERFDLDGDGVISIREFAKALPTIMGE